MCVVPGGGFVVVPEWMTERERYVHVRLDEVPQVSLTALLDLLTLLRSIASAPEPHGTIGAEAHAALSEEARRHGEVPVPQSSLAFVGPGVMRWEEAPPTFLMMADLIERGHGGHGLRMNRGIESKTAKARSSARQSRFGERRTARRGGAIASVQIAEIMTRDIVTVTPATSIQAAATLMADHGISGLPVVDADRQLVGIISEGDLILRQRSPARRPCSVQGRPGGHRCLSPTGLALP